MSSIFMYIFSKTRIGKLIDGKKTIIGAVLVIVVAALHALEQLAPMFPNAPWIGEASKGIIEALRTAEPVLETLGLSFLTVGVLHKSVKAKS
jgi:hypothetical protein